MQLSHLNVTVQCHFNGSSLFFEVLKLVCLETKMMEALDIGSVTLDEMDANSSDLRPVDEIIGDLKPNKSKKAAWNEFKTHCKVTDEPGEYHFTGYFDYLHRGKNLKSSTLWSTFSKLNYCFQMQFGKKLQDAYPRLIIQLKRYNQGYTRKVANTFTQEQIDNFLVKTIDGPEGLWLLRKAVAAIAFCGGLRVAELNQLQMKDISESENGLWVEYTLYKSDGETEMVVNHNQSQTVSATSTSTSNVNVTPGLQTKVYNITVQPGANVVIY